MKRSESRFIGLIKLSMVATLFFARGFTGDTLAEEADWPQWRGPNRDGISNETGLLKSWPAEGPKALWRVPIGEGYAGISISEGHLYTMGAEGDDEFVVCLNAETGKEIWRVRVGDKFTEGQGDGPRSTPTVDGNVVFALSARGNLYALDSKNGGQLWERDFIKEFGSDVPSWGFATSPLVEGDLLLVEVGGEAGKSIVAFEKKSGRTVWNSHTDKSAYSSPIPITFRGRRQIIFLTSETLLSLSPMDGGIYWKYPWLTHDGINVATPIFIEPDQIFISASYDKGAVLLRMKADGDGFAVEEIWKSKVMKNHFNSSVLLGDYLYGFDNAILTCILAETGEEQWRQRGFKKGSLILADGHLIILGEDGKLALVEVSPEEYLEIASFQLFEAKCWTVPTLAGGSLYVRNQKEMVCLALKDEPPRVGGAWIGTWGVDGAPKEHRQRLDCQVVALGADQWGATFEGECGRPYKYTIEMLGRNAGDAVLFKGSADLGEKDGGVYDWIGRATEDKFVGFYTSQKYTGTFEMSRTAETSGVVDEKP